MSLFTKVIEDQISILPTEADAARGFFEAKVRTQSGEEHIVRLTMIPATEGEKILHCLAESQDIKGPIRALAEPKFASDEFLDSLPMEQLAVLFNAATALILGIKKQHAMMRHAQVILSHMPSEPSGS